MTDAERQRIQKQLQEIDAWRASPALISQISVLLTPTAQSSAINTHYMS